METAGMRAEPIIVEETYAAPVEAVWQAITDKNQMRRWYFETINDFEPEVGFETKFDVECEGQVFPHHWKVFEAVPEKKIAYHWRFGGYEGTSIVTWELSKSPEGTHLKLTHEGCETFPQDNPVFSRESGVAGWRYFLRESLKQFLDGFQTTPSR